jgi:hypothetical protein
MAINQKQIAIACSLLPSIVESQPATRRALIFQAGEDVIEVIVKAGLTMREQKVVMSIADLYLQFFHEDESNQKWSELMEASICRENQEKICRIVQ